jgi:hypothetical protein
MLHVIGWAEEPLFAVGESDVFIRKTNMTSCVYIMNSPLTNNAGRPTLFAAIFHIFVSPPTLVQVTTCHDKHRCNALRCCLLDCGFMGLVSV